MPVSTGMAATRSIPRCPQANSAKMILGIEIGGTKLQLGVGKGDGHLIAIERFSVNRSAGAAGILAQIKSSSLELIERFSVSSVGIGFGGPIDYATSTVIKSHHVDGWDGLPIVDWCQANLGRPAKLANDCDAAALGEASFGAGRGCRSVLYVTVGTGIGGGFVLDGKPYFGNGLGAVEIGHLRLGAGATTQDEIVEKVSSGLGIAVQAQSQASSVLGRDTYLADPAESEAARAAARELLEIANGDASQLSARHVAEAAAGGNLLAKRTMSAAIETLGWAIGQVITILAPEIVIVGGGVSLANDLVFMNPLCCAVEQFVFPPLKGRYRIVRPKLGESVVVHGAQVLCVQ